MFFLFVSHLRLSQWRDDPVVGGLNHFIFLTLYQNQRKWGKQRHRGTALHCHCLPLFYISHFCFIFTIIENVLLAIWFELQTSWSPNLYADQWATEDPPFHLFLFIHFSPKKLNIWYAPMIWDGILFAMEKC